MPPDGSPIQDPNLVVVPSTRSNAKPGQFGTKGVLGYTYLVTLPSSATTLSNGSGATMTVDAFTISQNSASATSNPYVRTITANALFGPTDFFNVGATLHIGPDQAVGAYSGNYTVTVQYQ